jgi:hypothetical protein
MCSSDRNRPCVRGRQRTSSGEQVRVGGIILADIRGSFAGGVARLTRTAKNEAFGGFLPAGGSFMPLRSPDHHARPGFDLPKLVGRVAGAAGGARKTEFDPDVFSSSNGFAFFAQLVIPGSLHTRVEVESTGTVFCLVHPDSDSWARVELGGEPSRLVTQGGPRRLWDDLEVSYELWENLSRPVRDKFMITVTKDGEQYVSLPETPYRWHLPL